MKKILVFGITAVMLFSLVACGGKDNTPVVVDETEGISTFVAGEPNWEDITEACYDEADGTSTFKVGEPNWNDATEAVSEETDDTSTFEVD
ncbi:MAG: hypothetical protein IKW08_07510, partial [Roseburia sp.]|nr:hypothetical protein [Roseburia sp.]